MRIFLIVSRLLFIVLFCSSLPVLAAGALTLCVDDQAHAPGSFPNKDGTMQVLIRMAAAQTEMTVTFKPLPWKACLDAVRSDTLNGAVGPSLTEATRELAVFPMNKDKADATRSLAATRALVFRLKGSTASWDGTRFSDVKLPVLAPSGYNFMTEKLKALKVPFDDQTKLLGRNFSKLIAGQGSLVIGFELEGQKKIAESDFAGKIEALPEPFTETHSYLAISKQTYAKDTQQIENLWNAIGKIKKSPEFRAAIKNIE